MPLQSSLSSRDEESQWVAVEYRRRRRVAFEETARGILIYPEDGEDLKVSVTEFQEQLGMQQARKRERPTFFEICRQGEKDVCIAGWARWNAQLKRSGGVGRRCQNTRQEVNYLSERQEIPRGMVEDNQYAEQSNRKYYDQIFEEMKELAEKRLWRCQDER